MYGCAIKALAVDAKSARLHASVQDHDQRLVTVSWFKVVIKFVGLLAIGAIKLSATFLYRRIFVEFRYQRFTHAWLLLLFCWIFAFIFTEIASYTNNLAMSSPKYSYGKSGVDLTASFKAYAITDVAADAVTLVLPIPMVLPHLSWPGSLVRS